MTKKKESKKVFTKEIILKNLDLTVYESLASVLGQDEVDAIIEKMANERLQEMVDNEEIEAFEAIATNKHIRSRKRKYNHKDHLKHCNLKGKRRFIINGKEISKMRKKAEKNDKKFKLKSISIFGDFDEILL